MVHALHEPFAQSSIAEAEAKERADRLRAARKEPFRLRAGGAGCFHVHSLRTGAVYDVLVGRDGFVWCSCPDVRTSELGRCKHIELVVAKRRRHEPCGPVAVLGARDTRGRVHAPLADVYIHGARGAVARIVGQDGFVDPASLARLGGARGAAASLARLLPRSAVTVRPEVTRLLERLEADERWAESFGAFERSVRAGGEPAAWARLTATLRHRLHPYQVDGVLFAARTPRAILGDDMGLGKTLQAIAAAHLLKQLGEIGLALIVCPASLKQQWAGEIRKFLGDAATVVVIEGGRAERAKAYRNVRADFVVLNYELVVKDAEAVRRLGADLLIADEAQRIKNWNTKTAKAMKALPARRALILTGTPLENRLAELHSLIELADARAAGPMWRLGPEFTVMDGKRLVGVRGLELIRQRLAPLFLRRERSLVASQLPERTDQVRPVSFTPEQAACHAVHAANAARIAAKKHLTEIDIIRLMAELTSMRLAANGMLLYEWGKVERAVREGAHDPALAARFPSPKLDELADVLESLLAERGTKIVIFSQWERMLRLAAWATSAIVARAGARAIFFHGQLSSQERAVAIADFHADPRARILFSTDAGGVGLNLQEAATAMIHLEVPWNPAVFEQRVGRIHRLGQKRPVHVMSLVTENCIETRIAEVVEQKRALFEGLFRGESDELRFDDESRGTLVDRVRHLLAGVESRSTEAVEQAPPLPPPPAVPKQSPTIDLGPLAQAALALVGLSPGASAPLSLPVTVRQEEGRTLLELPVVPPQAVDHLKAFLASVGLGR